MKEKKLIICFLGEAKKEDIFAVRWAKYFSERNHNVHFISYSLPENQNLGNIKVYIINKSFPRINLWPFNTLVNLPFTLAKVKKMIREIKPHIVHAQCVTSYGTLGYLVGFHPFVITAYGSDILITPHLNFLTNWSVKYTLKKADLITCDAEHMKEAMIKLGTDPQKIKIINFGVDTKKFSPGEEDKELKRKLGAVNSDIIISLRGLEPIYNIETLIKTVPLVLNEFPKAVFVVAGSGSEEKKLKNLARHLNIWDNVRFIGWVPNEDLPRYLRTADIYISTSLSDGGIASSTAEAMACGLPVVITNIGDNNKWVKDNENGFLIPVKTPEILAEKIVYLLKNEDKKKIFGNKAIKTIKERNDYYNEMNKMENIYYQLVAENY